MANAQLEAIRTMLAENPIIKPDASLADMRAALDGMGAMVPCLPGVSSSKVDAGGVPGGDARVEAGEFFLRVGVEVAAAALYGLGDFLGVARGGSLEEQVLDEVADAVEPRGFVAAANLDPHADGDGVNVRHARGGDADAVGQGRGLRVEVHDFGTRARDCGASVVKRNGDSWGWGRGRRRKNLAS